MRLKIEKRVERARLVEEILAAIPELQGFESKDDDEGETFQFARLAIEGPDPGVIVTLVDVDEAAVQAIIDAHDPNAAPPPPPPEPYAEMKKIIEGATSLTDIKKLGPWFDVLAHESKEGVMLTDRRFELAGVEPPGKPTAKKSKRKGARKADGA